MIGFKNLVEINQIEDKNHFGNRRFYLTECFLDAYLISVSILEKFHNVNINESRIEAYNTLYDELLNINFSNINARVKRDSVVLQIRNLFREDLKIIKEYKNYYIQLIAKEEVECRYLEDKYTWMVEENAFDDPID